MSEGEWIEAEHALVLDMLNKPFRFYGPNELVKSNTRVCTEEDEALEGELLPPCKPRIEDNVLRNWIQGLLNKQTIEGEVVKDE